MMIPGFVTIIVIEVSYVLQKKIRSAQNVTDVSFFCSEGNPACRTLKSTWCIMWHSTRTRNEAIQV